MFDSKKAKAFALFVAAAATAAIPLFELSPQVAGALAGVASFATLVVNFFERKGV